MITTLVIFSLSIILMAICIIWFPKIRFKHFEIQTFWIFPLLGAITTLLFKTVDITVFFQQLTLNSTVNPIKILILFISMTFMSIILEELGFFSYLASVVLKKVKNNQYKLFFSIYLLTSILTIFTSNDIIILTFTPFLIAFSKKAKINPIPYLVSEFIAANTWSMLLIIGNPTNIYLSTSANINFMDYVKVMWLPTFLSSSTCLLILFLLFRKQLKVSMEENDVIISNLKDKPLLYISLIVLLSTTILLVISSFINIPLYLITLLGAVTIIILTLLLSIKKKDRLQILRNSLIHCPYELIPFVLSMFTLTLSFKVNGISKVTAEFLNSFDPIFSYGISSFLASNMINNIPMSIFFSDLLSTSNSNPLAIFATIIGSNLGAFLTPLGALAGIMWMSILKKNDVKFSFSQFSLYGVLISIPSLFVALATLLIM